MLSWSASSLQGRSYNSNRLLVGDGGHTTRSIKSKDLGIETRGKSSPEDILLVSICVGLCRNCDESGTETATRTCSISVSLQLPGPYLLCNFLLELWRARYKIGVNEVSRVSPHRDGSTYDSSCWRSSSIC